MLQICSVCGAVNSEDSKVCSFCDAALESNEESPVAANVSSTEPEWRDEVARKLEAYRERRRRLGYDDSQADLPFDEPEEAPPETAEIPKPPEERVEIAISSGPETEFASLGYPVHPEAPMVPVAELAERRHAGLLDALFLLLAYGVFLGIFRAFGGHLELGRLESVVYAATFFLLELQYFALFTAFGGPTPGMLLTGLTVVSFDGSLPSTRQLFWRSFGYLISAGTFFLGFVWAVWDEDHLTWHDRISQTYITQAAALPHSLDTAEPQSAGNK